MDKDSFEYRSWLAYIIGLALIFIIMVACAAIFAPEKFATRRTFPILIIGIMICWALAAVGSYSRSQAWYEKRMSGWTPPQPKLPEGFFPSWLIKLIQKITGK